MRQGVVTAGRPLGEQLRRLHKDCVYVASLQAALSLRPSLSAAQRLTSFTHPHRTNGIHC